MHLILFCTCHHPNIKALLMLAVDADAQKISPLIATAVGILNPASILRFFPNNTTGSLQTIASITCKKYRCN